MAGDFVTLRDGHGQMEEHLLAVLKHRVPSEQAEDVKSVTIDVRSDTICVSVSAPGLGIDDQDFRAIVSEVFCLSIGKVVTLAHSGCDVAAVSFATKEMTHLYLNSVRVVRTMILLLLAFLALLLLVVFGRDYLL